MKPFESQRSDACARAEAATTELLSQRRRLMSAAALGPLALAAATMASRSARAAGGPPEAVRDLDAAAMALFDAAEAGRWPQARSALAQARRAEAGAGALEGAFTQAGGELHRFFQARNDLSGDLLEAGTAISVKDRRWLVSVADRIVARAGELGQPFVGSRDSTQQRIEVLIYLARRMRRALVWSDESGFRAAQGDFKRLWKLTASELPPQAEAKRRALDLALERTALTKSVPAVRELYDAVAALGRP